MGLFIKFFQGFVKIAEKKTTFKQILLQLDLTKAQNLKVSPKISEQIVISQQNSSEIFQRRLKFVKNLVAKCMWKKAREIKILAFKMFSSIKKKFYYANS